MLEHIERQKNVENAQDFRVEKPLARATSPSVGDAERPTDQDPVGRVAGAGAGPARRLDCQSKIGYRCCCCFRQG